MTPDKTVASLVVCMCHDRQGLNDYAPSPSISSSGLRPRPHF